MASVETIDCPFVPVGDRCIVMESESETVSTGGIYIPDQAQKKSTQGTVLALGEGRRLENGQIIPFPCKVGDVIVYAKYGGTEIRRESRTYLILRLDDIIAIVPEQKES